MKYLQQCGNESSDRQEVLQSGGRALPEDPLHSLLPCLSAGAQSIQKSGYGGAHRAQPYPEAL